MGPDVSFERANHAICAYWRAQGAAASTVEALMFALRCGPDALKEMDNQRRLSELNDAQLREVAKRLQNFKADIAPPWTPEALEALVAIWSELK
jgi:hypothetical protein